jgi:hypothetical protein
LKVSREKLNLDRYYPTHPSVGLTKDPGPAGAIGTNFEKPVPLVTGCVQDEKGTKLEDIMRLRD